MTSGRDIQTASTSRCVSIATAATTASRSTTGGAKGQDRGQGVQRLTASPERARSQGRGNRGRAYRARRATRRPGKEDEVRKMFQRYKRWAGGHAADVLFASLVHGLCLLAVLWALYLLARAIGGAS